MPAAYLILGVLGGPVDHRTPYLPSGAESSRNSAAGTTDGMLTLVKEMGAQPFGRKHLRDYGNARC